MSLVVAIRMVISQFFRLLKRLFTDQWKGVKRLVVSVFNCVHPQSSQPEKREKICQGIAGEDGYICLLGINPPLFIHSPILFAVTLSSIYLTRITFLEMPTHGR